MRDQKCAAERRFQCREQQPVIAARQRSRDGPGGKASDAIRHQPFALLSGGQIARDAAAELNGRVRRNLSRPHFKCGCYRGWDLVFCSGLVRWICCGGMHRSLPALLDQFGNDAGPAGLMACAHAGPGIAVEVFVEGHIIAPVTVVLKFLMSAENGPASFAIAQEYPHQAAGYLRRNFPQILFLSGTGGKLHLKFVAKEVVELLQRLDQEIVHRKPDRPAPVRVSTKNSGGRLSRLVVNLTSRSIDLEHERVFAMKLRKGADPIFGEKLRFVEHVAKNYRKVTAVNDREQATCAGWCFYIADVIAENRLVVDEPLHPAFERRMPVHHLWLQRFNRVERNQPHQGADSHRKVVAVGQAENVVVKAVRLVPERESFTAEIVHGVGDVHKMLEEFAGYALVGRVLARKFEGNRQHVQAIHSHPARAVGLLHKSSRRKRRRAVENSNVVEAEESALEDVVAFGVFTIDPPGEIQQQLVECVLEEAAVRLAANALFDLVDAPAGPRMNGWVDISESPFVRGQLTVRVHIPLTQHQRELFFCKVRVDLRKWNRVEREVPCGVPGIFPFVRHGNDVSVVKVRPFMVTPVTMAIRRSRSGRIALQPCVDVIVVELLRPEQSGKSLPLDRLCILRQRFRDALRVEIISLGDALSEYMIKRGTKAVFRGGS